MSTYPSMTPRGACQDGDSDPSNFVLYRPSLDADDEGAAGTAVLSSAEIARKVQDSGLSTPGSFTRSSLSRVPSLRRASLEGANDPRNFVYPTPDSPLPSSQDAHSTPGSVMTAEELCKHVLHTVYLGSENSSVATRTRSERLSAAIGGYHSNLCIDAVVKAVLYVFSTLSQVRQYVHAHIPA
jgi:hypothetical protein